jgi:hypothetical protein
LTSTVLKSIAYFDIFDHPLHLTEVAMLCEHLSGDVYEVVDKLVADNVLHRHHDYVSLKTTVEELVKAREKKTEAAIKYFKKLPRYAKIIKSFPYVEGIGVSGSLSKNVMHEEGDIDYFIITSPNRLWICRTMLIAFKKIVLLNSKKYFCINYFVDTNNLVIKDKNMFTAIETSYLLPVYNHNLIADFKHKNDWTQAFVNRFQHPLKVPDFTEKKRLSKLLEWMLKGKIGDKLDLYLMKFTYRKWQKKFPDFDLSKFELTMRTNRGVSKHHPRDFQNKVLKAYSEKLQTLGISE